MEDQERRTVGDRKAMQLDRTRMREGLVLGGLLSLATCLAVLTWEGLCWSFPVLTEGWIGRYGAAAILASALIGVVAAWMNRRQRRRMRLLQSAREQAELLGRRTQALLDAVFRHDPTAMVVVDSEFRVSFANEAARQIHGQALIGRDCFAALEGRDDICPDCFLDQEGVGSHNCAERRTAKGEIVEIASHVLDLPDQGRQALLVQRVVTEQRKLQARLLHQEKMAAFGLLAAGIAHDMGNPLSAIGMHVQLLETQELPGEARESLRVVGQEVGRLRRTLQELVGFSRRRRDEAGLVSVREVAQDALRLLHYDPRMRHVQVHIDADPDTPPVHMVEDHLMQVILNLLLNSLDAMPDGGDLHFEIRCVQRRVILRLRDTGHGMERSDLARAFEPMFTTKAADAGTGLGLSICRDIVRETGGDIELHSVPGGGTTVIVTLQVAEEEGSRARTRRAAAH